MGADDDRDVTVTSRTRGFGLAIAVVAVVLVLLISGIALTRPAGPLTPTTAKAAAPESVSPRSSSIATPSVAGACRANGAEDSFAAQSAKAAVAHTGGTAPGPLFNQQVQPYAAFTGPYAYVAAGAAIRDQGYGAIQLSWPSGDRLVGAYMIWSIINNSVPPSNGTLNGHDVNGTWTAYATPSPCWGITYIYTFVADVSSYVKDGNNTLSGFPSSATNGGDPWGVDSGLNGPLAEGVSLVAIYQNGTAIHQVTVYSGALTIGTGVNPGVAQLNFSKTNSTAAKTTYIVADGQLPDNYAEWNGTILNASAFPGNDPKESHQVWSYGNLSDTKTFTNVTVPIGANNTTAEVGSNGGDCLTWVGQVVSVGVAATKGPYSVEFVEQGLPSGTSWKVTTNGTTKTGTAGPSPTTIKFTLGNGSYTYTVPAVKGYLTLPNNGTYAVAGGPVLIRVIFHAFVYPVVFNETGLPLGATWWVDFTNSSQGLTENATLFSFYELAINVSNGTYHFFAGQVGLYLPTPGSGNVTVAGTEVLVTIAFRPPPLYLVTFEEHNLTAGTRWGGTVDSNWGEFENWTTNATFSLYLPNASLGADNLYPYAVPGYSAPTYIFFAVPGQAVVVDVNFTQIYGVRLVAHGLPLGISWTAYLEGTSYLNYESSINGTNYYSATNGSYTFGVEPVFAYVASPAGGPLVVDGANVTQIIDFSLAPTYALNFNETGLAPGTQWTIELQLPNDTIVYQNGTGTTITFDEPNGTYIYTPSSPLYLANPDYGATDIEGASTNVSIAFTRAYTVTFLEQGLPTGSFWEIYLSPLEAGYSYSNVIVFRAPNASYTFSAYESSTFEPSPSSGWANVTGANLEITIYYVSASEPTYTITFTETGLAPGANWTVECGYWTLWSLTSEIVFTEPDGTYYFSIPGVDLKTPNPQYGDAVVDGANVAESISFGTGLFQVTFSETGLPTGSTWYINVTSGPDLSATVTSNSGTTVSADFANGTYDYTAQTNAPGWTSPSASFTVAGIALTVVVPFHGPPATKYAVTFTESGLPVGSTWYVNISGQSPLTATVSSSSGTTVATSLVNGSYTFTASTSNPSWTTKSGGGFSVTGAAVNEPVTFTRLTTYLVTFQESGLPAGATWYVNITGAGVFSAVVTASGPNSGDFYLANGSYEYTAATNWKNWTVSSPVDFTVAGAAKTLDVTFSSSSSNSNSLGLGSPYFWIALAIAFIVLALLFILLAARRRKKKPPVDEGAAAVPPGPAAPPPTGGT